MQFLMITCLLLFSALALWIISTPWGKGRLQQTSIFGGISGVSIRNQILIFDTGNNNPVLARLLHNKPIGYGREFLRQYFSYLSPKYLFLDGWGEKYIVPEQGMLYISYLIFLLIFVWHLGHEVTYIQVKRPLLYYLILVALSLIPPSMTYIGSPNVNRSIMFGVLLIPAIAYGATMLANKHKQIFIIVVILLISECVYFGFSYKFHFDSANSITRQDAVKPLISYIANYKDKKVFLPQDSTMAIYYLFYNHIFDSHLIGKFKTEVRIPQIGNIEFIPESKCMKTRAEAEELGVRIGDIVAFKYTCGERQKEDFGFSPITFIKQTGELLGYRIYIYNGIESIDSR